MVVIDARGVRVGDEEGAPVIGRLYDTVALTMSGRPALLLVPEGVGVEGDGSARAVVLDLREDLWRAELLFYDLM